MCGKCAGLRICVHGPRFAGRPAWSPSARSSTGWKRTSNYISPCQTTVTDIAAYFVRRALTSLRLFVSLLVTGPMRQGAVVRRQRGCRAETLMATRPSDRVAEEQAALRRVAALVARGTPPEEVFTAVTREV